MSGGSAPNPVSTCSECGMNTYAAHLIEQHLAICSKSAAIQAAFSGVAKKK